MSLKAIVSPSILSADFGCLAKDVERLLNAGADWLHIDVMDGHFVPNITIGAPVVAALRKYTDAFFDCHLMVSDPLKWVKPFAKAGASNFTFHFEAVDNHEELIEEILKSGMRASISIKPKTPLESVLPLLDSQQGRISMLLIMTVEPGFGGQSFMRDMMPKVEMARKRYPNMDIEVDGGIGADTVEEVSRAGANVIVSGSALFKASSMEETISLFHKSVSSCVTKQER